MQEPESFAGQEVVARLEEALAALERSFEALGVPGLAAPDRPPSQPADAPSPLTTEERQRIGKHLHALREEVREFSDFLAGGTAGSEAPPSP